MSAGGGERHSGDCIHDGDGQCVTCQRDRYKALAAELAAAVDRLKRRHSDWADYAANDALAKAREAGVLE